MRIGACTVWILLVSSLAVSGSPVFGSDHLPRDTVFAAGFEAGLRIDGRAVSPAPLAQARIEARVGPRTYTARSDGNGNFRIIVEGRDPAAFVELVAFGVASQANLAWASLLGRYDGLSTRAGGDGVLDADELAFVNPSPRTTAITANLRAYQGAAITEQDDFDRAVRAYQVEHTRDITLALALVSEGELALPPGIDNTLHVLSEMHEAQLLIADHYALLNAEVCNPPTSIYCQLRDGLPLHPDIAPLRTLPATGDLTPNVAFGGVSSYGSAVRLTSSSTALVRGYGPDQLAVSVTAEADGSYALRRPGDQPFYTQQSTPSSPLLSYGPLRLRASEGPDGLLELNQVMDVTYSFPAEPGRPDEFYPGRFDLPRPLVQPLPAGQIAQVPALNGQVVLLPMPDDPSGAEWRSVYDIHGIQPDGTGSTSRRGDAFVITQTAPDTLNIAYPHANVDLRFVNEEQPGIWRVQLITAQTAPAGSFQGLLMLVDPPAEQFTAGNVPGDWRTRINGFVCDGPWRDLRDLAPGNLCNRFGFSLVSGGGGTMLQNPNQAVDWSLNDPPLSPRLLLDRHWIGGGGFQDRRGWELIRREPGRIWVLESVSFGSGGPVPPVSFDATSRLVPFDLE